MTRYSSSRSRSRSRHGGGGSDEDGFRVHVADLSVDCSQKELDRAFQKFGDTFEIWLARNPPCFAFVVYKHKDDAEEAIREMNGQVLAGSRIRCSWAKPRVKGGRGGGSSSSSSRVPRDPNLRCFRCGDRGHFARDCTGSSSRRPRRYSDDDDDRRRRRRSRSTSRHRRRSRSHSRSRSRSTRRRRSKSRSRSRDERRRRHRSSHSRSRSNSRHRTKRSRSRSARRRSRSPADRNGKKQNDVSTVKEKIEETVASNGNKSPARSESGVENHEQEEEFDMNADDAGNKYDPTEQVDDEDQENNGEENQEEN